MFYLLLLTFINIFSLLTVNNALNYNKYFEPSIGKWKLLYTDNTLFIPNKKNNQCNLDIYPSDAPNKLYVEINRYENRNFILQKKTINSNVFCVSCELDEESNRQCSLFILQSKKLIQSIGIFEIPYLEMNYKSGMSPEYFIKWKVDLMQNDTYYIFEKNYYDLDINNEKTITTNAFLVSNLVSFIIGKLLQNIIENIIKN
jgi:hypothetical protein